jgi:hypothetical protein
MPPPALVRPAWRFNDFASGNAHDMDRITDHVGDALLAFGAVLKHDDA